MSRVAPRRIAARVAAAALGVAVVADAALAHGGDEGSTGLLHSRTVAAALFLVGVGALAVSTYADYVDRASRRATDVGVGLGVLCVLGSIVALWV